MDASATTCCKLLLVLAIGALGACVEPEILQSHERQAPAGIDFSGLWQIRPDSSGDEQRLRDVINNTDGIDELRRRASRSRSSRRSGGIAHIFLEVGKSLKVTQTDHALFISFDRSVVEEFRFGENRIVTIGAAEAQRASGWEGKEYVVETLDKSGMKLTERYTLSDDNHTMQRLIVFRSSKLEEDSLTQTFDKAPN